MSGFFQSIFRHPRRLGFIAFNLLALALLVSWILATQDSESLGIMGLPYYALGYVGMAILLVAWVGAWLAWGWMVTARRRRQHQQP